MKRFLLGMVCGLVVVAVANMGHAFLFFGGGGGGGHKKASTAPSLDVASLFNFEYYQFVDDNEGSNPDDARPNDNFDSDFNHTGNGGSGGYTAQNSAPVPEPATMVLLGMGLIGLAAFGRSKFKK